MSITEDIEIFVEFARKRTKEILLQNNIPGMVIGVCLNGEEVWIDSFGFSDIENQVPCTDKIAMRTASVCKCFTAVAAAKLYEEGKLDLDKPIHYYLPNYPEINFNEEDVSKLVTPRFLLTHFAGLRHYDRSKGEFERKDHYKTMTEFLNVFKHESLKHKPGTEFLYSGFGFTLLGAIIEKAAGEPFLNYMKNMLNSIGMKNTNPDQNSPLIKHRSRNYCKNELGDIVNAPYSDSSCKWASGGYLSTVGDLLKFGNTLLRCYNGEECFLRQETVEMLWTATEISQGKVEWEPDGSYGMGFVLTKYGQDICASHIGRATGGSSVIFIMPNKISTGVVVTILANLQSVNLHQFAKEIASVFHKIS